MKTEEEVKIKIFEVIDILDKLRKLSKYKKTLYIRDTIFGGEEKKKIRLRIEDNLECQNINVTYKYKISIDGDIKKEIEETLYRG